MSPDADIVHARALEHRGWIAIARADYATATESFSGAIRRLDGCRHYDRFLEAQGIFALSILAAERLDRPTWIFVEHRAERFDWSASGLAAPQFWVGIYSSMMYEADGRIADALRLAGDAEQLAGSSVLRLFAQCRRAAILRNVGERFAHADVVRRMRRELDTLDVTALQGDHQLIPLSVAEEVAYCGDVVGARMLLKRYDAQKPPSGDHRARGRSAAEGGALVRRRRGRRRRRRPATSASSLSPGVPDLQARRLRARARCSPRCASARSPARRICSTTSTARCARSPTARRCASARGATTRCSKTRSSRSCRTSSARCSR